MKFGSTKVSPAAVVRIGIAGLVGAFLLPAVVANGMANYAEEEREIAMLRDVDPARFPDAGARLAELRLRLGDPAGAARIGLVAATHDPLNVRAVRVVGLARELLEDGSATPIMRQALRLGWRDTPTLLWGLRDAAEREDVEGVLEIVDALARRQVQGEVTRPLLMAALVDEVSRIAFVERLAQEPSWREAFFNDVQASLDPAVFDGMEDVFERMAATSSPPRQSERLRYIERVLQTGDFARARAFWMRSSDIDVSARSDVPFDPRFEHVASRAPGAPVSRFEWNVNNGAGRSVAFETRGDRTVLRVTPGSNPGSVLLSQSLGLAPGTHVIRSEVLEGSGGTLPAEWQLLCAASETPLVRRYTRGTQDRLSRIEVTVPENCPVQTLRLNSTSVFGGAPVIIGSVTVD